MTPPTIDMAADRAEKSILHRLSAARNKLNSLADQVGLPTVNHHLEEKSINMAADRAEKIILHRLSAARNKLNSLADQVGLPTVNHHLEEKSIIALQIEYLADNLAEGIPAAKLEEMESAARKKARRAAKKAKKKAKKAA